MLSYLPGLALERHRNLTCDNSGCICTLGNMPIPTALLIDFAIRRWFRPLKPVLSEWIIRPVSVAKSAINATFCGKRVSNDQTIINLYVKQNLTCIMKYSTLPTLYSFSGSILSISNTSTGGLVLFFLNFDIAYPVRSCGE